MSYLSVVESKPRDGGKWTALSQPACALCWPAIRSAAADPAIGINGCPHCGTRYRKVRRTQARKAVQS